MNIFRAAASNSTQPVSKTYLTAAQQINMACGPEYIIETIDYRSWSIKTVDSSAVLLPILTLFGIFMALFW
jgi:hypothetical protein